MKRSFYSGILAGSLSLVVSLPAFADISASEVRDELVSYYESFGYTVTIGSEDTSGGVMTISDMSIAFDIPEEDGQIVVLINEFGLSDTGDGAVDVLMPDSMTYTVKFVDGGQDVAVGVFDTGVVNFSGHVSGKVGNIRIESEMDSMSMSLASLNVGGNDFPVTLDLNFGAFESDYKIKLTDDNQREVAGEIELESAGIVANAKEPGGGDGFFSLTADFADITSSGIMSMVALKNMVEALEENPLALFSESFLIDADLNYGESIIDVAFKDGSDQFSLLASSSGGLADVVISKDVIAYEIVQQGVDLNLTSSDIPFPAIKLAYDEFAIGFSIPLAKADGPSDFHMSTAIRGLTVGESIWAMIDPGQAIPRDPATAAINVSGKAMVLVDLFDLETLENLDNMDSPPMLPISVNLNELLVSFGGALLNGDGEFTFNFENPVMMGGMPLPIGEVNLSLKGGFGLMDKLGGLGLIPPDASMGIRAMLGAFAKPVGDDHFESKVEVTAEGAILANGQRIQ